MLHITDNAYFENSSNSKYRLEELSYVKQKTAQPGTRCDYCFNLQPAIVGEE